MEIENKPDAKDAELFLFGSSSALFLLKILKVDIYCGIIAVFKKNEKLEFCGGKIL